MSHLLDLAIGGHFRFSQNQADAIYEVWDIKETNPGKWRVEVRDCETNKSQYYTGEQEVYIVEADGLENELDLIDEEDCL